jgi:hypothetical protein
MSVRSDVGPLVDAWQGRVPAAYSSAGVLPDEGNLAGWMEAVLATSGGLKLTRSAAKDVSVYDRAVRWLRVEGVDVERALARVTREREHEAHRVRATADRIRDLALDQKAAEKALVFEARGVRDGAAGFGRAKLAEAQDRVNDLAAALDEACSHDAGLVRQVRRSVA